MKILITGDLVVSKNYDATTLIDHEVISLFKSSDYNIVNLEAPITKSQSKINKTGPHIKSNENSTKDVLSCLEINLVTLANNHILDYDEQGVIDTLLFCKENSISTIGAGKNKIEAAKIHYLETPEGKIGFVNVAENEWSSATSNYAGANGMDLIKDTRLIKEAKSKADFVFIIIHGGHEYYNLPSPRMQKQYRFYAEQGADIVIGHHTHCYSGFETYNNVPIFYSLGNFLFTEHSQFSEWYSGLVLQIEIEYGKLSTKPHFIEQSKEDFMLNLRQYKLCEEKIEELNKIIGNEQKLDENWNSFISRMSSTYLKLWSPFSFLGNRYVKAMFQRLGINFVNKKGMTLFLNLMRCEAHSDLSKDVINNYIKSKTL
jgi:hypothetical protein